MALASQKGTRVTPIDVGLDWIVLWLFPRWIAPNHVTTFRFLSIPFVVYFLLIDNYTLGVPLFIIAAFSDAIDGALARTRGQITDWGKLYDPLADKLLVGSVLLILVWKGYIYPLLAFLLIMIEGLLIVNGYYRRYIKNKVTQAVLPGKIKMVLESVALGLLLLYMTVLPADGVFIVATYAIYLSLFFALWSLIVYRSI